MEFFYRIVINDGNVSRLKSFNGRSAFDVRWTDEINGGRHYKNVAMCYQDAQSIVNHSEVHSVVIVKTHQLPNGKWRDDGVQVVNKKKSVNGFPPFF